MLYRAYRLIYLTLVLTVLLSACSSGVTPAPSVTVRPTTSLTKTSAPTANPTMRPTATATSQPAPTSTRQSTGQSSPAATAQPTGEAIADRQTFDGMGISVAYPGAWQVTGQAPLITISSPELTVGGQHASAEIMIGASSSTTPKASLQARWNDFATQSPNVKLSVPAPTMLGGEAALTSLFSDPSDGSHGWVTISGHGGQTWYIITQAIPTDNWTNYEATFRAMLRTFRFTQ